MIYKDDSMEGNKREYEKRVDFTKTDEHEHAVIKVRSREGCPICGDAVSTFLCSATPQLAILDL
jgi:hypothetical protein